MQMGQVTQQWALQISHHNIQTLTCDNLTINIKISDCDVQWAVGKGWRGRERWVPLYRINTVMEWQRETRRLTLSQFRRFTLLHLPTTSHHNIKYLTCNIFNNKHRSRRLRWAVGKGWCGRERVPLYIAIGKKERQRWMGKVSNVAILQWEKISNRLNHVIKKL